ATFGKDVEITARLRRLHDAEAVAAAGNGEILGAVAGDLKKDAGIGSAFVRLAGGMEEARPETETGRDMLGIADGKAHRLQRRLMRLIARDVGKQRAIIALP